MLKFDSSVCTGCRICEQACQLAHYQGNETDGPRIKIHSTWPDQEKVAVCRQCPQPSCIKACPSGALRQEDGNIRLEEEKCTQCYECFAACPFQARVTNRLGFPSFCDTCEGFYQCARFCPANALKRGDKQ
ncbi:MAG: 4Fe-4S binding protein [Desulfitobacteriaceae bacterium]